MKTATFWNVSASALKLSTGWPSAFWWWSERLRLLLSAAFPASPVLAESLADARPLAAAATVLMPHHGDASWHCKKLLLY